MTDIVEVNNQQIVLTEDSGPLAVVREVDFQIVEVIGQGPVGPPGVPNPPSNDGDTLGTPDLRWSDLFLADGGVINWPDITVTHSTGTLTFAGGMFVFPSAGVQVGSSVPFSDAAGTLTLQNIDALDATTEQTIESAIDTLANLTSIQGRTVTLGGNFTTAGAVSISTYMGTLLDDADAATARSTLGVVIGTNVQAWDADLDSWALLTRAAGFDTFVVTPSVANLMSLLTDDAAGLGTFMVTPSSANLAALVTDETGSGALVFGTSPTLTTSALLSSGFVFNWNAGDVTLTHAANALTFAGATSGYAFDYAVKFGSNAVASPTDLSRHLDLWGGLYGFSVTNSTLNLVTGGGDIQAVFGSAGGALFPDSNDKASLGKLGTAWSDLHLALGAVININGDITLTHAADTLTFAGGQFVFPSAGITVGASIPFSDSAGTLTLQNVDALDATTESTIEAAIDTLANLTSIQSRTVSLGGNISFAGSFTTAGAVSISAYGATLVDDADAATARTTLGVVIGTNVQAWDADLDALAALASTGFAARTASNTWAQRTLTAPAAGFTITNPAGVAGNPTFVLANDLAALEALAGTNTIYYRSGADTWSAVTIGGMLSFSTGTLNVGDAELTALAGLTSAADALPYFTGSGTAATTTLTSFARTLLDDTDASTMRTTLGLVIGTNVQAYDADLLSWASVTRATGFDTFVATPSSANLATLVTDETGSGALVFAAAPAISDPDFTGLVDVQQTFALTGDISPSQITSNQNDYSPTGLSTASVLRLNTDAARTLTGLAGGSDGRVILIHNTGTNDLVLSDEDVLSTAANRFALASNVTLAADQSAMLQYDSTSSRWRMIGGTGSGGGGGSGDVTAAANFGTDNVLIRSDGSLKGVQNTAIAVDDTTFAMYPTTNDVGTLGKSGNAWGDLFLASGGVINFNNGDVLVTHSANTLTFTGASSGYLYDAMNAPSTNDGAALGSTTLMWSDLFLASGGVINFNNGDVLVTHSANTLTFAGGTNYSFDSLVTGARFVPSGSTVPTNGMYLPAANTLGWGINSAAELALTSTALYPASNDGLALGIASTNMWSDLFLASGSVINFDNGDVTVTHSSNKLDIDGGVVDFDQMPTVNGASLAKVTSVLASGSLPAANSVDIAIDMTGYSNFAVMINGMSHNNGANRNAQVAYSDDGTNFNALRDVTPSIAAAATANGVYVLFGAGVSAGAKAIIHTTTDTAGATQGAVLVGEAGITVEVRISLNSTGSFDAGTYIILGF